MENGHLAQEIKRRSLFMLETADSLGQRALELVRGRVEMHRKPDHTKVTTVDIALNQEFIQHIATQFPNDLVWGEEASNSGKGNLAEANSRWMWVIDPIDSTSSLWNSYQTKNFRDCRARIQMAVFAPGEKQPCMSVIHNPFQPQKMTLFAGPDGAFYQSSDMAAPRAISLKSGPRALRDVQRFEYNTWPGATPDLHGLSQLVPEARRVWHQLFMGSVALGDVDFSVFPGPSNPHDVAPGAHIVHAVGGTVLSLKGDTYEAIDWRVPVAGVVGAATPGLANEVVSAINKAK